MDELAERVHRVTKDLEHLRQELDRAATAGPEQRQQLERVKGQLSLVLLNDFKASVDHMRHVLWAYIETLTREQGDQIERALQAVRMQRTTDMLRALQSSAPDWEQPEARSFLEQIQAIANTAVERHLDHGSRPAGTD